MEKILNEKNTDILIRISTLLILSCIVLKEISFLPLVTGVFIIFASVCKIIYIYKNKVAKLPDIFYFFFIGFGVYMILSP